jgi:hypothetical protein
LWAALEQNISGEFRDILLALLAERNVYQAEIMNRAIAVSEPAVFLYSIKIERLHFDSFPNFSQK